MGTDTARRFATGALAYVVVFTGLMLLLDPVALTAGGQWLSDAPRLGWAALS